MPLIGIKSCLYRLVWFEPYSKILVSFHTKVLWVEGTVTKLKISHPQAKLKKTKNQTQRFLSKSRTEQHGNHTMLVHTNVG
jgi:hypothetical protein